MKILKVEIELEEGREEGEHINRFLPYVRKITCDGEKLSQEPESSWTDFGVQRSWIVFMEGIDYSISLIEHRERRNL